MRRCTRTSSRTWAPDCNWSGNECDQIIAAKIAAMKQDFSSGTCGEDAKGKKLSAYDCQRMRVVDYAYSPEHAMDEGGGAAYVLGLAGHVGEMAASNLPVAVVTAGAGAFAEGKGVFGIAANEAAAAEFGNLAKIGAAQKLVGFGSELGGKLMTAGFAVNEVDKLGQFAIAVNDKEWREAGGTPRGGGLRRGNPLRGPSRAEAHEGKGGTRQRGGGMERAARPGSGADRRRRARSGPRRRATSSGRGEDRSQASACRSDSGRRVPDRGRVRRGRGRPAAAKRSLRQKAADAYAAAKARLSGLFGGKKSEPDSGTAAGEFDARDVSKPMPPKQAPVVVDAAHTGATAPAGEKWQVVEIKPDPEVKGGKLYVAEPLNKNAPFEGDLGWTQEKLPGAAKALGVSVDADGRVTYPGPEGMNARLADDYGKPVQKLPWRFKEYAGPDGQGGEAPVLDYIDGIAKGEVPVSAGGKHHFHDLGVHALGFLAMPEALRVRIQADAANLVAMARNTALMEKYPDLKRYVDKSMNDMVLISTG